MKAYVYQGSLLCEDCGDHVRKELAGEAGASIQLMETGTDSDTFPQGPYPNGGGEADSPQNCDHCGTFLENPLTNDGDAYLRKLAEPYSYADTDGDVAPWSLVADRAEDDGKAHLAEWIRYYFAAGM
jgi:hypothetical protein